MSVLSKYSGGCTYYYPAFFGPRDGIKFDKELRRCLTRSTAFESGEWRVCSETCDVGGMVEKGGESYGTMRDTLFSSVYLSLISLTTLHVMSTLMTSHT